MIIGIASGKGGTGKTTVATSLAIALAHSGAEVIFLDCDVEAPNASIFLRPNISQSKPVNILVPNVDNELCTGCGRCAEACQFNAIVVLAGTALVLPQLCHGCGSCTLVCDDKAINELPRPLGLLESGDANEGIDFGQGMLHIGEALAVPIIRDLKSWKDLSRSEVSILDSPPGTSCPVVESLRGSDFVILVTEPTPFGLHDLKLAVELTRELNIPSGIIINRDGIGNNAVENYCHSENLPILMRIPFDRNIAQGIAKGKSLIEIQGNYLQRFQSLFEDIESRVVKIREIL